MPFIKIKEYFVRRVILKISGEGLGYDKSRGIDPEKVKNLAVEIKDLVSLGDIELCVIMGAGNIWRGREAEAFNMQRTYADYMGMLGTILNALALQTMLEDLGCKTRVMSSLAMPSVAETYIFRRAERHLEKGRIVIFGGGTGLPFFSTDTTAALRAAELGCDLFLMAKNGVDGVYDKDPRKHKDAKRYQKISHKQVVEDRLEVMDLTAITLCLENNIDILVFNMNERGNIKRIITNPEIGTLITSSKERK